MVSLDTKLNISIALLVGVLILVIVVLVSGGNKKTGEGYDVFKGIKYAGNYSDYALGVWNPSSPGYMISEANQKHIKDCIQSHKCENPEMCFNNCRHCVTSNGVAMVGCKIDPLTRADSSYQQL